MMFSCCCARVDLSWKPICDCYTGHDQCSYSCINERANYTDSYYSLANTIFQQIRQDYPDINLWLTGHSLGGALASLTAMRNNYPAIAFESPGDLMYASRLGLLPSKDLLQQWMVTGLNRYIGGKSSGFQSNWWKRRPGHKDEGDDGKGKDDNDNGDDSALPVPRQPRYNYADYAPFLNALPIYHVGNNGDPVFLGVCTGPASTCYYAGYALESKCHVGKTCVYDVPDEPGNDNGGDGNNNGTNPSPLQSRLDVRNHRIEKAVKMYFEPYPGVPECKVEPGCVDCETWDFV
jgi:putative lipase involved disintegration of autophagic bodies